MIHNLSLSIKETSQFKFYDEALQNMLYSNGETTRIITMNIYFKTLKKSNSQQLQVNRDRNPMEQLARTVFCSI